MIQRGAFQPRAPWQENGAFVDFFVGKFRTLEDKGAFLLLGLSRPQEAFTGGQRSRLYKALW